MNITRAPSGVHVQSSVCKSGGGLGGHWMRGGRRRRRRSKATRQRQRAGVATSGRAAQRFKLCCRTRSLIIEGGALCKTLPHGQSLPQFNTNSTGKFNLNQAPAAIKALLGRSAPAPVSPPLVPTWNLPYCCSIIASDQLCKSIFNPGFALKDAFKKRIHPW